MLSEDVTADDVESFSQSRLSMSRSGVTRTSQVEIHQDEYGRKQVNDYLLLNTLGRGAVSKAVKIYKRAQLNRKRLGSSLTQNPFSMENLLHEIELWESLNSRYIIKLFEVIDDPEHENIYLVMEYADGGSVRQIQNSQPIPEAQAKWYFCCAVLGVDYLHAKGIVHRDLKPDNLLLVNEESGVVVKIGDFNVSEYLTTLVPDDRPVSASVGSPAFMAPELLFLRSVRRQSLERSNAAGSAAEPELNGTVAAGHSSASEDEASGSSSSLSMYTGALTNPKAADVWALGVSLYSLIFAKAPFAGPTVPDVYGQIQHAELEMPWVVSDKLTNLLQGLLDKDPSRRLTVEEIREHDWCRGVIAKLESM